MFGLGKSNARNLAVGKCACGNCRKGVIGVAVKYGYNSFVIAVSGNKGKRCSGSVCFAVNYVIQFYKVYVVFFYNNLGYTGCVYKSVCVYKGSSFKQSYLSLIFGRNVSKVCFDSACVDLVQNAVNSRIFC